MNVPAALLAGAGLGLASTLHCAAMCGPLVGASCTRPDARGVDPTRAGAYVGARAFGYGIGGALAGALGAPIAGSWQTPVRLLAALAAAVVIARAGLALLRASAPRLATLGVGGSAPRLATLGVGRPRRRAFPPALLGLATAVFPCGALLGALLLASTTGSALSGALAMIAFSIASLPGLLGAVLGVASLAGQLGRVRVVAGALLLALAGITVVEATMAAIPGKQPHACCRKRA
jgi:sulfite exporter TauE/SafE